MGRFSLLLLFGIFFLLVFILMCVHSSLSPFICCLSNKMGTYIMFEKDYSYRNVGDVCL